MGCIPLVPSFRRKRSFGHRVRRRGRELRKATSQLDLPWARTPTAGAVREAFLTFVLKPLMDYYTTRRASGGERLANVRGPVILVANHTSHMDTPVILAALPWAVRRRTTVAAAADYFYRNRAVASLVSLIFNTVPMDRSGGKGLSKPAVSHLDRLLDQGWSLLLYPEGTRSRQGKLGRVRKGAAVLAARHQLPIVPIRVTGTRTAMPPGRIWPKRLRGNPLPRRHRVEISFGDPIPPTTDTAELTERVQKFFEDGARNGGASARKRLARSG
jgi:1-acyl-sn-glycerol-3-phosphate acyltransferase